MKLEHWLSEQELDVASFAARIGVSRQALYRYLDGTRHPRKTILLAIEKATGGKVKPADWFACDAAE